MSEVGCLKDMNYQNLEANEILLGNNSLRVAGFVSIDSGGTDSFPVAATALSKNSIHILGGNGSTGSVIVTLPTIAEISTLGISVGDFFTFLVGAECTAAAGHAITCPADDEVGGVFVGALKMIRFIAGTGVALVDYGTSNSANTVTTPVYIRPFTDKTQQVVRLDSNLATGAGLSGSFVTFTYIGTPGTTNGTEPTWNLSGEVHSFDIDSTGAKVFAVHGA